MELLRRLRDGLRRRPLRATVKDLVEAFGRDDVLTFGSAISFQILYSLIPLALFGLGLLGTFGLEEQWTREWAPEARDAMSPAAFQVVDDTVRRVLSEKQVFWTTAGAALAIWKVSAATRSIMDVFDRIYGARKERPFAERLRVSLLLGTAVAALVLGATACVILGDDALRNAGIELGPVLWLRWPAALALLFGAVALLVAFAPVKRQPLRWVTFGSTVAVLAWVLTSLVLGWYLTAVADYGSVFGALATIVILLTYVYFATVAFLTGVELDNLARDRAAKS